MRITHWVWKNNSGMHRVAESIAEAERALGHYSVTQNTADANDWEKGLDTDIYVVHTHLPDIAYQQKGKKIVWVGHGTPEHCFQISMEQGLNQGYGAGDAWMVSQHWINRADASVTFWERHASIWASLNPKAKVFSVPLGVDREYWKPVPSKGKWSGEPSVLTAENAHYIKYPLDLFIAMPKVMEEVIGLRLHAWYLPRDQHRWWFPLVNANGLAFRSYLSEHRMDDEGLRNAFSSVDYYCGLVRYGDYNRICLEAKACGTKLISYEGNPYADYWVHEGDQRRITEELTEIFKGNVPPRETLDVLDIKDTASILIGIYEGL